MKCEFVTWDVPVKDDCPVCGQTMFKRSGKGFKKPFCINEACENFLPEDRRGYPKKTESSEAAAETPEEPEKTAAKKTTTKKTTTKKTAAKKTAEKKTAEKKTTAKKTAEKKTAAKKTTKKTKKGEE